MPRSLSVDLDDLVRSIAAGPESDDEVTDRILDAAAELFARHGVRRCTVDDIAEHSGLGRTTVYRRFDGRSQIVTAVLARECRRFFGSIVLATSHLDALQDAAVEGFLTGLRSAETSVLSELVRSEPEVLRLLTIDAGPVVTAGRDVLVAAFGDVESPDDRRRVAVVAEVLVRLAISFVLDGRSTIHMADAERARRDLHALLDPVLDPLAELRP